MKDENKALQDHNVALLVEISLLKKKTKTSSDNSGLSSLDVTENAQEADLAQMMVKLGQHFFAFWSFHIKTQDFSHDNRPTDWCWDDAAARYANPLTEKQGITAELYAALPAQFHRLMDLASKPSPTGGVRIFISQVIDFIPVSSQLLLMYFQFLVYLEGYGSRTIHCFLDCSDKQSFDL